MGVMISKKCLERVKPLYIMFLIGRFDSLMFFPIYLFYTYNKVDSVYCRLG